MQLNSFAATTQIEKLQRAKEMLGSHADRAPAMLQNPEGTKFADMHFGTLLAASGHQTRRAPL